MIVLVDTDILLDVAIKREPFYKKSVEIISMIENHKLIGFVAWHTLSNFYYLTSSESDRKTAKRFLEDLLAFVNVATVDTNYAKRAFSIETVDFEDAMQISSAISCNADYIITRNVKHYKKSPIKTTTPEKFLAL